MKSTYCSIVSLLFFFLGLYSCKPRKDLIQVEAYSSYNNSPLSTTILLTFDHQKYNDLIQKVLLIAGLPDTDIEVETTDNFGAFSVMNTLSDRRFLLYNPAYFDSVYNTTKTEFSIMSICFHELGHLFYRHPLKHSYASHIYEMQADRYSGFQMALTDATLDEAISAILHFADKDETYSHPRLLTRLEQLIDGYSDAKIRIFKDSTYFKNKSIYLAQFDDSHMLNQMIVQDSAAMIVNTDEQTNKRLEITVPKTQTYILYGIKISLTAENDLKLLSNNKVIGNLVKSKSKSGNATLNFNGVSFELNDNIITAKNPDGSFSEVGYLIYK
ncbi:hypothetical protein [Sphingobacterium siyangense]|uniref:hypothetical protein n=1 Tax=Sphingobacterium siyangense TaxID=459529 RepID=UPI002FDC9A33